MSKFGPWSKHASIFEELTFSLYQWKGLSMNTCLMHVDTCFRVNSCFYFKFSMAWHVSSFCDWLRCFFFFFSCLKESKCLNMLSRALSIFLVLWFYNLTTVKLLWNSKTSTLVEMYFSPLQMNNFKKVLRTSTKMHL